MESKAQVRKVASGELDAVQVEFDTEIAGYILPARVRDGHKMGDVTVVDHMVYDGLTDAFEGYHMGITAENIAEKYAISREQFSKGNGIHYVVTRYNGSNT